AVVPVAQPVEAPLPAGEPLHEHLRVLVDEDAHLAASGGRREHECCCHIGSLASDSLTSLSPRRARLRSGPLRAWSAWTRSGPTLCPSGSPCLLPRWCRRGG